MINLPEYFILFAGALIAAAISGSVGFGGALLLLPLLAGQLGTTLAVPLLTVVQLIGNLSRVFFGFRQIHWRPVVWFLAAALPASVLGALLFVSIPASWATRSIGLLLLVFVALRLAGRPHFKSGRGILLAGGAATGLLSGLAGSAGPLGAAVFLSLGLPPVSYVASEATTALVMHGAKTLVYLGQMNLPASLLPLAVFLGMAMVLGTWISKRWIERLPAERFRFFVTLVLVAMAVRMIWHG